MVISRRAEALGREILQHSRPPVFPAIMFSFRAVTRKHIDIFSQKTDFDGMSFDFFMNFLNIEKKNVKNFLFQYFMFSSRFMLFPTFKKVWKNIRGGGGGVSTNFF